MAEIIDLKTQTRIAIIRGVLEHEAVHHADALAPILAEAMVLSEPDPFQDRAQAWMRACFKPEDVTDKAERNRRAAEEFGEFLRAAGMEEQEAVAEFTAGFRKDPGDVAQETGGVLLTVAGVCSAHGVDMMAAGETELARVCDPETMRKIRAKHDAKPRGAPLPGVKP